MRKTATRIRLSLIIFAISFGIWLLHGRLFEPEILTVNSARAEVIDGDSFRTADSEFRIYGIDAPEYRQQCQDDEGRNWDCGKFSRSGLESLLGIENHACEVRARDKYQRAIVTCTSPAGADLGAELVLRGLALSADSFDAPIYATEERYAERTKRGIWKGSFVNPKIWRGENRR